MGWAKAAGAHLCFLPWLLLDERRPWALRELAFEPWSLNLGSGGSSPQAPWGLVGVGHVSCVTPSLVSTTGGAELTTLASTARVSRSMISLMGMFMWNPGPSFADRVSRALMWHSTTSQPAFRQMPEPFGRLRWPVGLSSMEILWVWLEVRIERERSTCPCPLLSGVRQGHWGSSWFFSLSSM